MKKILLLTPRFPFPVIGGDKLRIYNIAKYLSAYYRITLVSLYSTDEEERSVAEDGLFERVYKIKQPGYLSGLNAMKNLIAGDSLQSGYFYNRKMLSLVKKLAPEHDMLFSHLIRTASYVKDIRDMPKVCEMTDAISQNYKHAKTAGNRSLKKYIYSFEQKRCLEYEIECLRHFERSVLVSDHDRDYLRKYAPTFSDRIRVIPNGVDYERLSAQPAEFQRGKIVFIGNMRTVQNADAAYYFARDIFRKIKAEYPDSTFWIIGADPTPAVKSLSKIAGVNVVGKVNDILSYAHDAMVSVCPIRIGAGVQNKILESMAMGVPVVTSSLGLLGLQAMDMQDILVADTPDEFCSKIYKIYNDASLSERIKKNARSCITKNYSWDKIMASYKNLIDEIMQ
ncbi:MAG TPA: glycosyltransferase [Nitrospirae bacterium]|nr:glycosyl transferases group 1 [bacterium BMS3Abin06]HDH12916.1 glycosyltransferase [Nitrospirota bacterium]HDZ01672.1 glycosyltransferase [Nitrospirota bacterium]